MVKCEEILLTPDIAAKWKEKNVNNFRRLSTERVNTYASEMLSGNWKLNGESIVFDENGNLVNGQHRIEAVIKSNTPIRTMVMYGVKKEDCVFDSGLARSATQIARSFGLSMHNAKMATVKYIFMAGEKTEPGRMELIDYYKQHDIDFDLAFDFATKGSEKPYLKKAGCVSAVYCAIVLELLPYETIIDFCKIVNSNMPQEGFCNEAAFALVNTINAFGGNGRAYMNWCFNVTWEALMRLKKQSRSKRKYNGNTDNYITIIKKVRALDTMILKGEAI